MRRAVIVTIIMTLFLIGNTTNSQAGEAYLLIDGIPGGAMDSKHKGWMKIHSYSWSGERPPSSASKGSSRTRSRAVLKTLDATMNLDGSFPKLALALSQGKLIPRVVLEELHPQTKQPFLKIELGDVIVSGIQLGSGNKQPPIVSLNLDYGKIQWTYTILGGRAGKKRGNIQANWDVRSQKGK